jgi:hypothetical protein
MHSRSSSAILQFDCTDAKVHGLARRKRKACLSLRGGLEQVAGLLHHGVDAGLVGTG